MRKLKVLIGCEESQTICKAFRELGHKAFSCDIQECSGGHPEWHYQDDIFNVIKSRKWDLIITHPPCTHLAVSGARHFKEKQADGRQQDAIDFFINLFNTACKYSYHVAQENPVCIMSNIWRKPDQIIQPFYFGDEFMKTTCLWLHNLPHLYHNAEVNLFDSKITHISKGEFITFESGKKMSKWYANSAGNGKERSKTFPGIANAMATQWSEYILNL